MFVECKMFFESELVDIVDLSSSYCIESLYTACITYE